MRVNVFPSGSVPVGAGFAQVCGRTGGLLLGAGCAWPSPVLIRGTCPAPELPGGTQDLILSHAVWEGSSHSGLFVVSLSSPAQLRALLTPSEAGLRAQLPALEKGCSPSRAIIPNASRNSRILGPQPVHFVLFLSFPAAQSETALRTAGPRCPAPFAAAPSRCRPTHAVPCQHEPLGDEPLGDEAQTPGR